MNWYVLYTVHYKTKKVISYLNRYNDIIAFMPEYELCQRKTKEIIVKPMFHNYVFVKTHRNQNEFNDFLLSFYCHLITPPIFYIRLIHRKSGAFAFFQE